MVFSSKTINEWAASIYWTLRKHCKGTGTTLDLSKYTNRTGLVYDGAKYSLDGSVGLALLCEDHPESCYIWDAMISLVNQFGNLKELYDAIQTVRTTLYAKDLSVFSQRLLVGQTPQSNNPFSEDALFVWVGALFGIEITDTESDVWKNAETYIPVELLPKTIGKVADSVMGASHTLFTDNFTVLGFLSGQYKAEKKRERISVINSDELIAYLRSVCDARCFIGGVLNSSSVKNSFTRYDGGANRYCLNNCYEMAAYLFDTALIRAEKVLDASIESAVSSVVNVDGEMDVLARQLQYAFECLEIYNARNEIKYFDEVAYPGFEEKNEDLIHSRQTSVRRAESMAELLRAFSAFTGNMPLRKKLTGDSDPLKVGIVYGGYVGKLQASSKNSSDASSDLNDRIDDLLASLKDILRLKKSVVAIGDFLNGEKRDPHSAERRLNGLCSRKEVSAFTEELAGMVKVLENDIMPLFDGKTECYSFYKSDIEKYIEQLKDLTRRANEKATCLPEDTANDVVEINQSDGGHIVKLDDDLRVQFSLLDEDFSELSFTDDEEKSTALYDYSYYHRLVDATVDVRKQPVFGNLKRISAYHFFKPFSYQVDSVHTMLSRFEGRGVFGDQVGLGKTLQALMTAYTMFKHGAIRNVVVIATRQTIGQWRDNELKVKFRGDDGKCLFDVYPEGKSEFGFDELFEALERDDKKRTGKKPKVYTISVEGFKNALPKIKAAIDASDYYNAALAFNKDFSNELRERVVAAFPVDSMISLNDPIVESVISDVYSLFEFSDEYAIGLTQLSGKIEEREDIDSLKMLRLAVLLLARKMSNGDLYYNSSRNIICGADASALGRLSPDTQKIVEKSNGLLEAIDKKILKIEAKIAADASVDLYRKKRVIDLLVFDEVQELLVASSGNEKEGEVDGNVLRQEFIARIPKKYCILLSATPIRSDLSDIFNLMYMVDKNRLGTTRREAEERFYNAYCGGHRSLSAMANAPDPEKQFAKLNGLINTMFTRKRLYDEDVIESIARHTATQEEVEAARAVGRIDDGGIPIDYGGQRFYDLMLCLSVIKNRGTRLSDSDKTNLCVQLRKILDEKDYVDINVVLSSLPDIVKSIETASMLWRKRRAMEERKQLSEIGNIDVIDDFILSYDTLLKKEAADPLSAEVHALRVKCDLDISYINRGMLDFYSTYHTYSTTFLADFLDWRRPYKHGVALPFATHEEKVKVLGDLLVPDAGDDAEFMERYGNLGITHDELVDIQKSKVVVYDKWTKVRRDLYRRVRAEKLDFGEPRKVYIDGISSDDKAAESKDKAKAGKNASKSLPTPPAENPDEGFTQDELVDLEYYPGSAKYNAIQNKPESKRTPAEKYILRTFKPGGKATDGGEDLAEGQRNRNFRRFKDFSAEDDGNWNSLYFFEYTKVAGTDLKAASTLIIGQLDERDQNYMEPLRFEQLIGRISRTGQTERCLVLICLLKGYSDTGKSVSQPIVEFNKLYYDLLSDPHGFDLLGACQAEVDFVVPVVMACARRLFSEEWSYHEDEIGEIDGRESAKSNELLMAQSRYDHDQSRFRAVYRSTNIPYIAPVGVAGSKKYRAVETIPDILQYAFDYNDKISVVCNGTLEHPDTPTVLTPTEAIKEMVRYYAMTLSHDAVDVEE